MATFDFETITAAQASTYSIALESEALAEGHSGPTAYTFTVTRTGSTSGAGTVSYSVAGEGPYEAGATDFVGGAFPSGTVEFAAGQKTRVLTIQVQGDGAVEQDEGFTVTLSPAKSGDQIGAAQAKATIYNDEFDRPPHSGGDGSDTIQGTAGADTIDGGDGASYLRGAEGDDVITGGADFDDINGNQGDDTASGGLGDDWVVGGRDDDVLTGDGGDDIVYGNLGDDVCEGGDGKDIVRGGQQNDVVKGGAGDDWLAGDRGDDTITGGSGADIFHTFAEASIDRVVDFSRAEGDRVLLAPGTVYTVSQVGADTVVQMQGGGQMVLVGVAQSSLSGDWIFGA